jgi:hypothetical protein
MNLPLIFSLLSRSGHLEAKITISLENSMECDCRALYSSNANSKSKVNFLKHKGIPGPLNGTTFNPFKSGQRDPLMESFPCFTYYMVFYVANFVCGFTADI